MLEATLKPLRFLLETAWRIDLPPELGLQLLILLTFLAATTTQDGKPLPNSSSDLQIIAFSCLALALHSLTASRPGKSALTSLSNIPALGHAITTILDGVKNGTTAEVNLQALHVLSLFVNRMSDRDILSSFLPGILSSLTQVLTPSTQSRRNYRILARSLVIVRDLLANTVADRFSFPEKDVAASASSQTEFIPRLDGSWLAANAAQTKLALANIIRQRKHERIEVREALQQLGFLIVSACTSHLSSSVPMMLDTLIVLAQKDDSASLESELQVLIASNDVVLDAVRSGLYDQFFALPRLIRSNDFAEKERLAGSVGTSLILLNNAQSELSALTGRVATSLRDSLAGVVNDEAGQPLMQGLVREEMGSAELALSGSSSSSLISILHSSKAGEDNAAMLSSIAESVAKSDIGLPIIRDALDQLASADTDTRLPSFWLAVSMLKYRFESTPATENILAIELASEGELDMRDETFAMATAIINDAVQDSSVDWRVQAVALDAVAFQARMTGPEFRSELVDVLYSIVHLLGSGSTSVRQHAVACINRLAQSCEYPDARAMIVANNDYLVNGVSARLNNFDLSPEIPQVLSMLVKLSGPALIPYLDDVIDNIFDALGNFHGYPVLVEMLFTVLKGVVEEGVKSPAFLIDDGRDRQIKAAISSYRPRSLAVYKDQLCCRRAERKREREDAIALRGSLPETLPELPWKGLRKTSDHETPQEEQAGDPAEEMEKPAQLSRTYMLLQRIATLTQHHLPSNRSPLRASLLTLLATAIPYLASHEDTLLPLIHTLWPVLVARLADPEAFVVAGVLDVMAAMAASAGGFVRGRVRDIWPRILRIGKDVGASFGPDTAGMKGTQAKVSRSDVNARDVSNIVSQHPWSTPPLSNTTSGRPALDSGELTAVSTIRHAEVTAYTPTTTKTVRHGLERLLMALSKHITLPFGLFADVAGSMMWRPGVLEQREDVQSALQIANKDAMVMILQRAKEFPQSLSAGHSK